MAHFARLDENNFVTQIAVINNDVITVNGVESEQAGIDFLTELYQYNKWKQCSYNGNFRKNFPGAEPINWVYDTEGDAFRTVQPFPSWTLNYDTFKWHSPIPYPEDGFNYEWSEISLEWVKIVSSIDE